MSPSTPAAKAAPSRSSYDENRMSSSMSWDQQPSSYTTTRNKSLEENAEQVSHLFTTTITALAADVTALKQLTTWKEILQQSSNGDDNVAEERREEFLESLVKLDELVSLVEKKVVTLRQVVADENDALDKLNLLRDESAEQNANLQYLVERCRQMKMTATATNPSNNKKQPTRAATTTNNTTSSTAQIHPTKKGNFPNALRDKEATVNTSRGSSTEENHAITDGDWVYLDPVTPEELERVPRTTKGRVQVVVLNEALANIEQCFHKKTVAEQRKHQQLVEARRATLSQQSYDENEDILDDEEVLRNMVVFEQELRKSCSFFASGESTARTVLSVLKELKRIKQVPAKKKGVFTYKLCLD